MEAGTSGLNLRIQKKKIEKAEDDDNEANSCSNARSPLHEDCLPPGQEESTSVCYVVLYILTCISQ